MHRVSAVLFVALAAAGALVAGLQRASSGAPDASALRAARSASGFAEALHVALGAENRNRFVSPFSAWTALSMTHAGARGRTAAQMAAALRLQPPSPHAAAAALLRDLRAAGNAGGCTLRIANGIWLQRGERLQPAFVATVRDRYGAGLRELDFARQTEAARATINAWVSERTEAKIRELLRRGDLDPSTALVLTNAILFKGKWEKAFDPRRTVDAPFHLDDRRTVRAPMMRQTGRFACARVGEVRAFELPYAGGRLSMVVLYPERPERLSEVERIVREKRLGEVLGRLAPREVPVGLPRFSVTSRVDLGRALQTMGMTDAFRGGAADFSGINGRRDLSIALVMHQARVDVDEAGTEAAAATAVVMMKSAPIESYVADRPFLFLIRDRSTGAILFTGRVANPLETEG